MSLHSKSVVSLLFASAVVLLSHPVPATAQSASGQAGVAAAVRGDVTLVASAVTQSERVVGETLGSGDKIFLGDNIETGPNSGMQIMLLDETIFTIGPDAGMVIDEFVYDPSTSTGQVTASIVKGAFRFVSGRVAKETPQNMNVRTPVGTIGIRGTSAAGRVDPPNANGDPSATIVLLGPGANNNANERAGRILVTNGGNTVEISRSGFGTTIFGLNGLPTPPVRFEPARVSALTGGLGTNGGARPASNNGNGTGQGNNGTGQSGNGGPSTSGGNGQVGAGRANAQSGQGLGAGATRAIFRQQTTQNTQGPNQELVKATEPSDLVNTAVSTYEQLRSIQTGTASFDFGVVPLTHVSGPGSGTGSYQAAAHIDFGAATIDFQVFNVVYNFGGGNQSFLQQNNGGNIDSYANRSGFVTGTSNSATQPGDFLVAPTDGSTVDVVGAILNNQDAGVVAARGIVSVTIDNGTDVLSGAGVATATNNNGGNT